MPDRRSFDLQALAHDLRHSLATVSMLADVIETSGLPPATARWWEALRAELAAMRDLCERTLVKAVSPAGCELSAVVRELAEVLRYAPCTLRCTGTPVWVLADRVIARRVAANLIRNAMTAAGPSGTVQVRTGLVSGWAELVVEDDGPGFADVPWGIGLRLVAGEVARARGSLDVGRSPMGGAAVRVQLPPAW